ncbi:MAG: hypothetical protein Q4C53_00960 [Clostridia bacterium]|nr:hypothetical protein [Clostridia bacterium]
MNEKELSALIEQIVANVLAEKTPCPGAASEEGRDKILVVGDTAAVPDALSCGAVLCPLADYEQNGNIRRYKKVVLAKLTLLELADLALGRASCPAVQAAMEALLNGMEVLLIEEGLPHRGYSGKGSTRLYALLEEYVRTLQSFGVKSYAASRIVTPAPAPLAAPKFEAPKTATPTGTGIKNPERLITESLAKNLAAAANGGTVHLMKNAIVTPSALDLFRSLGLTVEKDL